MHKTIHGIACVVRGPNNKILLLKRSPTKKLFPGKWFVVGAYPLNENDDFEKKAHLEMVDETGQDGEIINSGELLKMEVDGEVIDVHTFLARRQTEEVLLNDEHTEYKWVDQAAIKNFDCVPGMYEMMDNLLKR